MNRISRSLLGALLVAAFLAAATSPAWAIPRFARKYATSCATCHQAFPRLNAVGDSFRVNGFRFVDNERYLKDRPVEMGDEAYKRLWPNALWPTDIPRTSPLSIVTRFMAEYDMDGTRPQDLTFLLPEEVEFVWADTLGEDISFYGDVIWLQKDFGGLKPDSWATLKAWLQFQSLFGPDNKFNLRLGTVGTQTMNLYNARDANGYSTHFYLYSTWVMPKVNLVAGGLADFKGNNFTIGPQAGLEMNGFGKRWFYALGLANGNPEWSSTAAPDSDISFFGMGQGSDRKDLYLNLVYKIGGMPFDRSGEAGEETLTTGAEFWRDDHWSLSLFGYDGRASVRTEDLEANVWEGWDDFWRLGVGVQKQYKDVSFSAIYLTGNDDNPYGNLSPEAVDSTNWHFEVLGFAYPWLMPYARFESLELDVPTDVPGLNPEQDMQRVITGAKLMFRPNVSLTVEGAFYTKGAELEEGFDRTLFLLFAASF